MRRTYEACAGATKKKTDEKKNERHIHTIVIESKKKEGLVFAAPSLPSVSVVARTATERRLK